MYIYSRKIDGYYQSANGLMVTHRHPLGHMMYGYDQQYMPTYMSYYEATYETIHTHKHTYV